MYFFCFSSLILMISFISPIFAEDLQISTLPLCGSTMLGERQVIQIVIDNLTNKMIILKKINLSIDNNLNNPNNSILKNFTYPIIINPFSEYSFKSIIVTKEVGIHYVDLNISYSTGDDEVIKSYNQQICNFETYLKNNWLSNNELLLSALIFPLVAGLVGFLLKRNFENRDTKHQLKLQKLIEHDNWRLQHFHDLSTKYYFEISKISNELRICLELSFGSKSSSAIKNAYYYLLIWLSKYKDFEIFAGGKFLFLDDEKYEIADIIDRKIQAIFVILPFEGYHINEMIEEHDLGESNYIKFGYLNNSKFFKYFESWINSEYCLKSKENIIALFEEIIGILSNQGMLISHPSLNLESFIERNKSDRGLNRLTEDSISLNKSDFWFLYLSEKEVTKGKDLSIFGKGFNDDKFKYEFKIGTVNKSLLSFETEVVGQYDTKIIDIVDNNHVIIQIPETIPDGTYDIFAEYYLTSDNKKEKKVTAEAIVIIITNGSSYSS